MLDGRKKINWGLWPKVGFPSASLPCEEEGEGGLVGRDDAGWAASEPERGQALKLAKPTSGPYIQG